MESGSFSFTYIHVYIHAFMIYTLTFKLKSAYYVTVALSFTYQRNISLFPFLFERWRHACTFSYTGHVLVREFFAQVCPLVQKHWDDIWRMSPLRFRSRGLYAFWVVFHSVLFPLWRLGLAYRPCRWLFRSCHVSVMVRKANGRIKRHSIVSFLQLKFVLFSNGKFRCDAVWFFWCV